MSHPTFFQSLLKEVNNPAQFVDMVNMWMEDPQNNVGGVGHTIDRFLAHLMDEQDEPCSRVDCDQLFDALKIWMWQASVEQRCAMMFNTDHMVGLSCVSRKDDVQLLKSIPLYHVFVNSNQSKVALGFVSNLLTNTHETENSLNYILSSSEFAQIVNTDRVLINGEPKHVDPSELESLLWRALVPVHNTTAGKNIAQLVQNVILDNLNATAVYGVLDVLSANPLNAAITTDFLTDPRFLEWSEKDVCLRQYLKQDNTIFPAELIPHFPPPSFEAAACHCAYLIINLDQSQKDQTAHLFDYLHTILHTHEDRVTTVRRTIEKLETMTRQSLTTFPDEDIEMMLNCLSENDIQWWRDNPWDYDQNFSINQYPRFVKQGLLNEVEGVHAKTTCKKRVL